VEGDRADPRSHDRRYGHRGSLRGDQRDFAGPHADLAYQSGDQGDVIIWLDQATVDHLGAMRGPAESYSELDLEAGEMKPRENKVEAALPANARSASMPSD
jgi:hypothetical protein